MQEIRTLVYDSRVNLDALGSPRQTTLQQRQFLSRIATKYQSVAADSLRGNYDSEWDAKDSRKLRMHLHLQNEQFAIVMTREGHTRAFRNVDDTVDSNYGAHSQNDESIYTWIRQRCRESRRSELPGTVNLTVLENLFRQQAAGWRTIATTHLDTIDQIVSKFNERV